MGLGGRRLGRPLCLFERDAGGAAHRTRRTRRRPRPLWPLLPPAHSQPVTNHCTASIWGRLGAGRRGLGSAPVDVAAPADGKPAIRAAGGAPPPGPRLRALARPRPANWPAGAAGRPMRANQSVPGAACWGGRRGPASTLMPPRWLPTWVGTHPGSAALPTAPRPSTSQCARSPSLFHPHHLSCPLQPPSALSTHAGPRSPNGPRGLPVTVRQQRGPRGHAWTRPARPTWRRSVGPSWASATRQLEPAAIVGPR